MHQILLHNCRPFPSKTLLFSQKLFIHHINLTHNRITRCISTQIPASLFSNADYTSTIQKNKSLSWHGCTSCFREFPATQSPQLTAAAFGFFSFHLYSFSGLYKKHSFSFSISTTVNVRKSFNNRGC